MTKLLELEEPHHDAAPAESQPRPQGRRWATRARTGCLYCRVRRVKCDEGRPRCKSCTKRNIVCRYTLDPADVVDDEVVRQKAVAAAASLVEAGAEEDKTVFDILVELYRRYHVRRDSCSYQLTGNEPPVVVKRYHRMQEAIFSRVDYMNGALGPLPARLIPPAWEVAEASAFFNEVVHKDRAKKSAANSRYNVSVMDDPYDERNMTRVANALYCRIWVMADLNPAHPRPEECYLAIHLWQRLLQVINLCIKRLARDLADMDNAVKNQVLETISAMAGIESHLGLSDGRAHVRAYLKVLRHLGPPAEVRKDQRLPLAVSMVTTIIEAVIGNTLTRHDAIITEAAAFSDKELTEGFSFTSASWFQCPSVLFTRILEVARLRDLVAAGASGASIVHEAEEIEGRIDEFDADYWTEAYDLPAAEVAYLLAAVHKAAVSLYCWSCIPASAAVAAGPEEVKRCAAVRARRLAAVLNLANKVLEVPNLSRVLVWPLAVAGFAAAEGFASERALVWRLLGDLEDSALPSKIIKSLQRFWARRGGDWDDCWLQPLLFGS